MRGRVQAGAGSFLICGLSFALGIAGAQTIAPATGIDALHVMSLQAGVIFAGEVIAVRRRGGSGINGATGVIEIDFAVDDAIRGVSSGAYTLREWAGLWPVGDEPFRVGQRYLMLLHAPGPAGLSSPIGGPDGTIPIRGAVNSAAAIPAQPDTLVVDLRWIATSVVRPVSYQPTSAAHPIGRPGMLHPNAVYAAPTSSVESESPDAPTASPVADSPVQNGSYTAVLAMLRQWERDDHATR